MTGFVSLPAMDALVARCMADGHRLTALRRDVLGLLVKRGGRASAYELINELPGIGRHDAPPSVYRALHFLISAGVVTRIASTNTFVIAPRAPTQHVAFLVCNTCGAVKPVDVACLDGALTHAAKAAQYEITHRHTEINGICAACRGE
ncbi:transcriptional repressor [Paraburkholderia sp. Ac-20336]|uniref:Fur family transcriptional regulator n=1 Tax=Paraburkholderia sp. Ac-20336 TaxID=2703886 RepID=UPI00197E9C25|nr:Fur family transcriptional regulator [Paraburkholderia sp. Ac-20336]MBN3801727.1 transcriptional repressor [Paraburkholderia sp. Ac-20336]